MRAASLTTRVPAAAMPGVTVDKVEMFENLGLTAEMWDRHVLACHADLYVSYDWCRIWWRHFGKGRRLRLYVFREGGRLVGIAPMVVETVWLGAVRLTIAKRVGADSALTVFALPIEPCCARAVYSALFTDLIECERCDAIWLGYAPHDDPTSNGMRAACQDLATTLSVLRDTAVGVQTVFSLPTSFEAYLGGLDKRQRQNYGRQLKQLKQAYTVECDTVRSPIEAVGAFGAFVDLHDRQWRAEGKLGQFGDWPGAEAFNLDLVRELSRSGRLRVHRLTADGQLLAGQYAFVFGDTCYWRLTARATAVELHRYGLGVLGLVELIRTMMGDGVRRVEGGIGHYDYKLRFGAEEKAVHSCLLVSQRGSAPLRARLFLAASGLLHLCYYRVWFLKLAPRMPLLRRPLWRVWIRSRL